MDWGSIGRRTGNERAKLLYGRTLSAEGSSMKGGLCLTMCGTKPYKGLCLHHLGILCFPTPHTSTMSCYTAPHSYLITTSRTAKATHPRNQAMLDTCGAGVCKWAQASFFVALCPLPLRHQRGATSRRWTEMLQEMQEEVEKNMKYECEKTEQTHLNFKHTDI